MKLDIVKRFIENNKHYIKIVMFILGIIVGMNMKYILPKFPEKIRKVITHKYFRFIIMFMAIYYYTKDLNKTIPVVIVFFLTSVIIEKLNIKEYFSL